MKYVPKTPKQVAWSLYTLGLVAVAVSVGVIHHSSAATLLILGFGSIMAAFLIVAP
jgi:hypothetical protein